MLDFCQTVSYYLKLSVIWVKKLLSEVEHLSYSPIFLIPYPLSDSLSNNISHKGADILLSCPLGLHFHANHSSSLPILPWEKVAQSPCIILCCGFI